MDLKYLLTGGLGAAGAIALVVLIGAGDNNQSWLVDPGEVVITKAQFDAVTAVCVEQQLWEHDALGLYECTVRHNTKTGRYTGVVIGDVIAPYDSPPKGARGLSPAFLEALKVAEPK